METPKQFIDRKQDEHHEKFGVYADTNGKIAEWIGEYHLLANGGKVEEPTPKDLLTIINESVKESYYDDGEEFDFSDFFYNFINNCQVELPRVIFEGEEEDIDLENWEILKIEKDYFEFCAGGDWQDSTKAAILYSIRGVLTCVKISGEYEEGLSEDDFLAKIKTLNE